MRIVHKFLVPFASTERHGNPVLPVTLRVGAEVVGVGMDRETGDPAIWVELDYEAEPQYRTFLAFATGEDIPDGLTRVGIAFCGAFVWHVYERRG